MTALLLDKVKTWMRRQGGTSELRALVYMDEIFGYFPPHREPAHEAAAPDPAQAGARAGRRGRARHPEPGGPRLQGPRQHGDLDGGDAADRSRTASGCASGLERGGPRGRRGRLAARGHEEARLPAPRRPPQGARPAAVALGDVVPARAADPRRDRAPHEGEGRGLARPRSAERVAAAPAADGPPLLPAPLQAPVLREVLGRDGRGAPARQVRRALQGRGGDGGRARLAAGGGERRRGAGGGADRGRRGGDRGGGAGGPALRRPARLARRGGGEGGREGAPGPAAGQARRHGLPRSRDERGVGRGRDRARPSSRACRLRAAATPRRPCARSWTRRRPTSRYASRSSRDASRRSGSPSARRC